MKEIKNQILALIFSILIGGLSAGEPEPIQFAWLTDTHIVTSTVTEDLRRAVADVNSLEKIAFTIISADIAELDIDGYLDTAKAILDQLETPYYIIPGNQDTKWSMSETRKFNQVEGFVESIPLIHRKPVVFGAWDGNLYALNTSSGELKWNWNNGRPGTLYSAAVPSGSGLMLNSYILP